MSGERDKTPGKGAVFLGTGLTAIFLVVSLHGLFGSIQVKGHDIIIGRRGIWVKAVLNIIGHMGLGFVWTYFDSRDAFTLLISGFISLVFYVAGIAIVRMFLKDIDNGFYENADIDYFPPAWEKRFLQWGLQRNNCLIIKLNVLPHEVCVNETSSCWNSSYKG